MDRASRPICSSSAPESVLPTKKGKKQKAGKRRLCFVNCVIIQAPISTIQISSQSDSLGHLSTAAAFIQISFIRTSRPGRNLKAGWVPADQAKTKPGQFRQTRPDSLCGVPRINLPRFASSQSPPSHPLTLALESASLPLASRHITRHTNGIQTADEVAALHVQS